MLYQSIFLLIAVWFVAVSASTPIPLQSCSTGSDIVKIVSATANVWPPVKGQEFTVDLSALVSQDINGGTYELKVAFDTIPLLDKTGSLTDLNVTFPIKSGPITLSKSINFPAIPISGAIDITIEAKDNNGNEIVCEKISLNLAAKNTPQIKETADVPIPYTSCAAATDIATLSAVTANAWPPVKGSDLIITVHGVLSKAVNNGTYEIKASFDGIPILDQKGQLSDLTTLPLPAGPITVSKTQNLPSITPSGKIDITITATSDDGEQILCIQVTVNLAEPIKEVADVPIPYTSCAAATDIATLSAVTANAWPPVKGSDLIITVHGVLAKAVNNGTYEIKASFDGIPILDQKGQLSDLTTLPLPAGPITVSKTQNLPSITPSGKIDITITATSDDGEQILCIQVTVNLASPSPAIASKVNDVPVPYDSCGSSSDIATLSSVTANVWPPKKNSDLAITANGNLTKAVTNGTYEIKAKFDGIQILKKHGDLSDLVALPLSAGAISIQKSVHLPKSIPSGKIQIEVSASSDDGSQILCFKVSVHMKSTAPNTPAIVHVQQRFPLLIRPFKVFANVPVPSKNCGSSSDLLPVTSVTASSWPPVAGSSLEMTTNFNAIEIINAGNYKYVATYMGIVVSDKTDTLSNAGFQLPINAGAYSVTQKVDAPSGLPSGHIVTTMSATDASGKALFCVSVEFDL